MNSIAASPALWNLWAYEYYVVLENIEFYVDSLRTPTYESSPNQRIRYKKNAVKTESIY